MNKLKKLQILSIRNAYILILAIMSVSVIASFTIDEIAYAQLSQSFAVSFLISLFILTGRLKELFSERGQIITAGFLSISTVSVAVNASIKVLDSHLWGSVICFAALVTCSILLKQNDSVENIVEVTNLNQFNE